MVLSVRWSGRIAAKAKASNPTVQAQNVLKQKLGIADMAQSPDPTALNSIKAFFAEPLSSSKLEALQALFAPDFDPVAMELNLTGFERFLTTGFRAAVLFVPLLGPLRGRYVVYLVITTV